MPAPLRFNCICGGSYATQAGLNQHQRRYCRGIPNTDDNKCAICNATFNTFSGMRQHMRHAHPEAYNADLEAESRRARSAWTEDEENALARAEAEYDGNDIYSHLLQFTNRTRDAIKGRRRLVSYKSKVEAFRQHLARPEHPEPEDTTTNETSRLEAALREFIANIPDDVLDDPAYSLRRSVLNSSIDDAKKDLDGWCLSLIRRYRTRPLGNPRRNRSNRDNIIRALSSNSVRPRKRRRLEYRLAQEDFKTDQKAYAERLLDGRGYYEDGSKPGNDDLARACAEIFSTPSRIDNEPIHDRQPQIIEISKPVSLEEITTALKSSKSNAAGSDGMTLADLQKIPKPLLALLYNSMLLLGHTPAELKGGRTIFIPKKNKDLHIVANWRPLTITPVIARLFNRILSYRLSNIDLHSCQRGFTRIDGCFANYATIETIIKSNKKRGQPLSLLFLDLSRAFDMVSHNSINRALTRLNIDPVTRRFIKDSYANCTTKASCESAEIGEFSVNRGVKQGDPHSPFLFNAVIDELLTNLNTKSGIQVGPNSKLCALAYADDVVIAATSTQDAQRMLDESVEFLEKRGLSLNASKCSSLIFNRVPSKKKLYTATEPIFKIGDEFIPTTSVGETFTYLGHQFSNNGLTPCDASVLNEQLSRIKRAPLKPQQKYCILSKYLIPRYIASLQRPNINKKILKDVDKKFRAAARKILSLFQHSCNSIFYSALKDGGLGLFNFSTSIPLIILSRWEKVKSASQLLEDTYNLSSAWVNRLQRLLPEDVTSKASIKRKFADELENSYSGGLANTKHHRACRSFILHPPRYWSGEDYRKAINLRYNLLPSRGIPSNPVAERRCRAGCDKSESLSHILQRCPLTHWQRIRRHDFIVKRLKTAALARNWSTQVEPHIRCRNGSLKKPDIIFKKGNKVIISDVGVHWEGRTTLEEQFHNKISIYSTPAVVERMQELHPDCEILVLPLIMGARGTWCRMNNALERELRLSFTEVLDLVTTTLRGGWLIHQDFMRQVWRNNLRSARVAAQ